MEIRTTRTEDLAEVMRIYEYAARYMAETGNPHQWTCGYPPKELIEDDIRRGVSYVMEENGQIEAVFAYIEGIDLTYGRIENGAWRSMGTYATVHRLASARRKRGISGQCFGWCAGQAAAHGIGSLRADTHMDNKVMQQMLLRNGFAYCGVIRLADGAPRLAYERLLWQNTPVQTQSAGAKWEAVSAQNPQGAGGQVQWNYNGTAGSRQKGSGSALGLTSMILGIVSLLLFCTCFNFITGIAAIVLGIVQISTSKEKAFAVAGISMGALSLLLGIFMAIVLSAGAASYDYYDSYDFYDNYYDSYDYYDGYDSYDDYYEEDGQTFL